MSFEYPEARILAAQIDETLKGKTIESYDLRDYERIQRIGFINKDLGDFGQLVGQRVLGACSSGNTIRIRFDGGVNLLLALEYGGVILYHREGEEAKYHLCLVFNGGDSLTIRLMSMGLIFAARDEQLEGLYMYKRDFKGAPSPVDLAAERFREILASKGTQLKPLLVGKDAVMTGFSNSAFQDVLFRAGIHPQRKASELAPEQVEGLYSAIHNLVEERLRLGGKEEMVDLFGKPGGYKPTMGPNMKDQACSRCGTDVKKMSHGGGQVYYCPGCQK